MLWYNILCCDMNFCIGDFLFFSTILTTSLSEVLNSTNCFEFGKQYESINLGCMAVYKRKSDQTGNRTFVFPQDSDCKHTTQTKHEFLTDNCAQPGWELTQTRSNMFGRTWKYLHRHGSHPTGQRQTGSAEKAKETQDDWRPWGLTKVHQSLNNMCMNSYTSVSKHCLVLSADS